MDIGYRNTLEQKQLLSQTQIQSLAILSMDNVELNDFLQGEYMENPMLEFTGSKEGAMEQVEFHQWYESQGVARDYEENEYSDEGTIRRDIPVYEGDPLEEYLLSQLNPLDFTNRQMKAIRFMIACLDHNGYFTTPMEEVVKMNDGEGNVLLSTKRYKMKDVKKELEDKFKNGEILEERITDITDKGFIIAKEGYNIFIPISLSGITRSEKIDDYKNKLVRFKLIECNFRPRRIIGSIKVILDEEKNKKVDEFWANAEVGKTYKGKVTSLSTYGAFVDLGAVQGLLHISEITWNRNTAPNEILKLGQEIEVIAIDVDKENKRIKLSYAEKGPDPWKNVEGKYNINDILTVKVVNLAPFGAFVELEPGIEGLVHLSQICERKITKPEEELRIGQKVNAKIIDMDLENKKIELSIRELENTSNEYKE